VLAMGSSRRCFPGSATHHYSAGPEATGWISNASADRPRFALISARYPDRFVRRDPGHHGRWQPSARR